MPRGGGGGGGSGLSIIMTLTVGKTICGSPRATLKKFSSAVKRKGGGAGVGWRVREVCLLVGLGKLCSKKDLLCYAPMLKNHAVMLQAKYQYATM